MKKLFLKQLTELWKNLRKWKFDKIAAIESRGFVFASAVSYIMNKPFIMLRKKQTSSRCIFN